MPTRKSDLHGNVPDSASVALLLIDVINDLEFEDGDKLLESALPMAKAIASLKERCKQRKIPVIYVNDNFGKWQSDFNTILRHCLDNNVRGRRIAELLQPDEDDYFVLKPKHSGFYSTTLDILLNYLGAETLILTGIATNICVLFTANDAYMRDFNLVIPADCVAANALDDSRQALHLMGQVLKAETASSDQLDLDELQRSAGPGTPDHTERQAAAS